MTTFSNNFSLGKTQAELDFVNVNLVRDNRLFVDPFAISQQPDRWSQDAHSTLIDYFQKVVDALREGRDSDARSLLSHLGEPNETRLGLSRGMPKGAGIGEEQAEELFLALKQSNAVKTGVLSSLEECELMIEGIGWDKISDLTTNVIRARLAEYTLWQCELHDVPVTSVALPPYYSPEFGDWTSDYFLLPSYRTRPILLVPKAIARIKASYDHRGFYRHFALTFLQAQHLQAGSSLVRTFKKSRRVFKTDLEKVYPCTKDFLFRFAERHPNVLSEYRAYLSRRETNGPPNTISDDEDRILARALREALAAISPGGESASEYHRLMIGLLEFVFFPVLGHPRKEQEIHQGRKRIDILMENCARFGIFERLHTIRKLPCAFIVFECKNYVNDIANPELDQIGGRFSTNKGKAGFICCRKFEDKRLFIERCRDTFRDDRGLIVPLDDATVAQWLTLIEQDRRAELDKAISREVDSVWVS